MINHRLDLDALAARFRTHRRVLVEDFLEPSVADAAAASLNALAQRELWYQVSHGDPRVHDLSGADGVARASLNLTYRLERFPLKNLSLASLLGDATRARPPVGEALSRAPEGELPETDPLRRLAEYLDSEACLAAVSRITASALIAGRSICYASRYRGGDFLGAHADEPSDRRVAWVLNLTRDWIVHWGGNLAVLDDRYEDVLETFPNRFNSIALMAVPLPHMVLPVSPHAPTSRLAVAGWFRG